LAVVIAVELVLGLGMAAMGASGAPAPGAGGLAGVSGLVIPAVPLGSTGEPATVGDVRLRDGVVAAGSAAGDGKGFAALVGDVHIGPFQGSARWCQSSSRRCGLRGLKVDFDASPVPLRGQTPGGAPITGSCRGGGMVFGYLGGVALSTTCTATVGARTYGPFALAATAPVSRDTGYIGVWCTDPTAQPPTESLAGCGVALNVEDPGLTPA
jgi:hypothetical protein